MNSCSQSIVRLAAAVLLVAALGCASKGATTLDDDANQPASERSGSPADEPRCGNGTLDEGEECDGDDLDGVTCTNLGFEGGTLSCDPMTCTFEVAGCTRPPVVPMGGSGS